MPTISDDALVVRQWEFSETSQTVALFTRDHGVVRALAKGARRPRAPFSGGLELLTRGHAVAIVKQTSDLAILTEWDLREVFWGPRRDVRAHLAALYAIDLLHHAVTDHDPHPGLFDAALTALRDLEHTPRREHTLLRFQWALLTETGYRPRLDHPDATPRDAPTLGFSPRQGGIVPDPGPEADANPLADPWRTRRDTVELLRQLDHPHHPDNPPPPATVARAVRLLAAYLTHVLGRDLPTRAPALGPLTP